MNPAIYFLAATAGILALTSNANAVSGGNMQVPNAVLGWQTLAQKYAQIYSILDPEEILAIIWNESTGNPNASNQGDPSWGLMGVTLPIAKAYAGITIAGQIVDPDTNVKAGAGFLAELKAKYSLQSPTSWVEAYNVGETKFLKGIGNPAYSNSYFAHLAALQRVSA